MKKIFLSICISASFLMQHNIVLADDVVNVPTALTYFELDGDWKVSGYDSGDEYVEAMKKVLELKKTADYERLEEMDSDDATVTAMTSTIENNYTQNLAYFEKLGQEADLVLEKVNAGTSLSIAKEQASLEMKEANSDFVDTYDPTDSSTSYNANSVIDTYVDNAQTSETVNPTESASNVDSVSTVQQNQFKVFNDLDCSYEEVTEYISKAKSPKTKAFSTAPNYSTGFKDTATASSGKIKGEEEPECQTIFDDINFSELTSLSSSDLPSIGDFGSMLSDLGKKAGENAMNLANDLASVLKEGFCERLSSDYLGDLAGDLIDDEYKDQTKDTVLSGTKVNKLDSEAGQNNFTYKVIKNQTGVSNSNLIKAIDVTREDQSKYQEKYGESVLDDQLDELEEEIFGDI